MFDSFCSLQRFQRFVNYFFEIIFSNFFSAASQRVIIILNLPVKSKHKFDTIFSNLQLNFT